MGKRSGKASSQRNRIRQQGGFGQFTCTFPALLLLLTVLLLPIQSPAQVFWSLTHENGQQNWILGTLHSEDPRLLEWPEPLTTALQAADRLALELNLDAVLIEQLQSAMTCADQPLKEVLDESLHETLMAVLTGSYELPADWAEQLCPWAVVLVLASQPSDTGMFMDLMLSWRARGAGLEVLALETVQEQIAFLATLTAEDQLLLVRHGLAGLEDQAGVMEKMITIWQTGDLDALMQLSDAQLADLPAGIAEHFHQHGLVDRNLRMMERARPWLEQGGLIIAVGALHLPGEQGLLALLAEEGWQLEGLF